MTLTTPAAPERSNRTPYLSAMAFFALLVVVGVIALLPKLRHRDSLKVEAEAASGPPIVLATRLKAGEAGGHLEMPASIEAFAQTPIYARTSGYVKARYVDIGDRVKKGQLLAVIDDPQTEQALLQAKASLAQSKAQVAQAQANADLSKTTNQRWQSLQGEGVVAQQDADQKRAQFGADAASVIAAQANVAASEANVRNLSEQASFARVIAPFSGIVLSRSIDNGSLISSGSQTGVTQMFTIGQADTVRVFANVPQTNAVGLREGQVAKVAVRELAGQTYTGIVARTSSSIDPGTRTLLIEVDLKNDGRILPGMYANVIVDIPHGGTLPVLLPANALMVRTAGPQAVVVDSDNTAHFRSIVLGRDLGVAIEVISGLKDGDLVVLSPGDTVVDGIKVRPNVQR
ncbi:efflux RND transporter periplasmic adaptor subunit [Granulicella sp. dw_53]|uniref:efflux RND transporter periplasmic adaptor subunit n=1 Tax=Granulicella sp. dw_53 TaxID=2719792 RepID=UPI001BD3FFB8|nr:efflux RND transporter periplasmic adaptor subunit [Granulicella sp. dw_53]